MINYFHRHLQNISNRQFFGISNFSLFIRSVPTAITRANAFLKNAFCIVGRFPANIKKKLMKENPIVAKKIASNGTESTINLTLEDQEQGYKGNKAT